MPRVSGMAVLLRRRRSSVRYVGRGVQLRRRAFLATASEFEDGPMNGQYLTVEWQRCQAENHKLKLIWSDKTPLKVHLGCQTCSIRTGKQAFIAYGDDLKSWGLWRAKRRETEAVDEASRAD